MKFRQLCALILILAAVKSAANPKSCEGRLGSSGLSLVSVISGAHEKGLITDAALADFLRATEWKNPFSSLSATLTGPQLILAFKQLEEGLSLKDKAEIKSRLLAIFKDRQKEKGIADEAHEATGELLSPIEISTVGDSRLGDTDYHGFAMATYQGRPIFFARQRVAGVASIQGAVYDPFASNQKRRCRIVEMPPAMSWADEPPTVVEHINRPFFLYPQNGVLIDFESGEDVSRNFALFSDIQAGNKIQRFNRGFKDFNREFKYQDKLFRLDLFTASYGGTAARVIEVANERTMFNLRRVPRLPYDVVYVDGIPFLYSTNQGALELLDLTNGALTTLDIDWGGDGLVAKFEYHGEPYLIFLEKGRLSILDLQTQRKFSVPTSPTISNDYATALSTFEYHGGIYAAVGAGMVHIFRLNPSPGAEK